MVSHFANAQSLTTPMQRSGYFAANFSAIMPPADVPITCARSI